jgi:hypothetical protein
MLVHRSPYLAITQLEVRGTLRPGGQHLLDQQVSSFYLRFREPTHALVPPALLLRHAASSGLQSCAQQQKQHQIGYSHTDAPILKQLATFEALGVSIMVIHIQGLADCI